MRSLAPAAQEERRRRVIGLHESGLTYAAIGQVVGLTKNRVFDICKRYRTQGMAGLQSGPRGPSPGTGRLLTPAQEAEIRQLICDDTPDGYGLRSDDVRSRSDAPRGKTPIVRPSQKRANVGVISAVSNQGERHRMVLHGAIPVPVLIVLLQRLIRDGGGKVLLILDRLGCIARAW